MTTPIQPVSTTPPNTLKSSKKDVTADDFIQMMITQLQNQDPLQPTSNQDLMAQMSQIGQLQSNSQLQDTLKGLAIQNQIGAGANLIGKAVEGVDADQDAVEGTVTSIRVENSQVLLQLHNGKELPLGNVTHISPATTAAAA